MKPQRCFGPGVSADPSILPAGDALPRTALPVQGGTPRHLEAHLQRLEAGAEALGQPVDWLPSFLGELKEWLRAATGGEDAALRLVLDPEAGALAAALEDLPATPQIYRLTLMTHPLGARQADPAVNHKGLSGPWGGRILAEAQQLGADDALLQWADGSLAETAIAAVSVEVDGVLVVPPFQGRVASLTERLELPAWAQSRGLRIEVAVLTLRHAQEGRLWCMNALRGIWPATLL